MRKIEELSMNAWPSLQTTLYDGWVIRFADGYTRRANSINPIYTSTEEVNNKIDYCEKLYREKRLPVVYKITEEAFPKDLDNLLEEKGYRFEYHTSLQKLSLENIEDVDLNDIKVEQGFSEAWLNSYCRLSGVNERNKDTLAKILKNIVTFHYYVSVVKDGNTVACGLGVLERDHIGLFDIVVNKEFRGQGYGEKLIRSIVSIGKSNGANTAYLQVLLNNAPALKLYSKVGFEEAYKYWYRVLD